MCVSEKDREHADLDYDVNTANKQLQAAENLLSTLRTQLKQKGDDVKGRSLPVAMNCTDCAWSGMDRKLKNGFSDEPFQLSDLDACNAEIAACNRCVLRLFETAQPFIFCSI